MKLHYEIMIEASPEEVWDAIVDDAKYRQWTGVFQEGSYFEGGWEKGDKIRFLSINAKGEKEGMIAEIAESQKNHFLSIKHMGMVLGGREDTASQAAKNWVAAYENYTLTPQHGGTRFEVDLDSADEETNELFKDTWPRALEKLKQVAEKKVIAA